MQQGTVEELKEIATLMTQSGLFKDVQGAAQAFVKIMAGKELGIPAFSAMTGINIIQGKLTLSAGLMSSLIKGSGKYRYKVVEMNDEICSLMFYEKIDGEWSDCGPSVFSSADAAKAGLTKNPVWKNFPKNMCFARAISNGAKWYCSDVFISPVYTPDELGAEVDEEGNLVKVISQTNLPQVMISDDYTQWRRPEHALNWAAQKLGITTGEASEIMKAAQEDEKGSKKKHFHELVMSMASN